MALTLEELKQEIERLDKEIREYRISKGLPPESPEPFIDIPLSYALGERLRPFLNIATKYAAIVANGQLRKIEGKKLAEYREIAELLRMTKGFHIGLLASGALFVLRVMDEINAAIDDGNTDAINISECMRKLHFGIRLMNENYPALDVEDQHKSECERLLNDEKAFQEALGQARDEYEKIKHLI